MKSKEAALIELNKNLVSFEEYLRWASEGKKSKEEKAELIRCWHYLWLLIFLFLEFVMIIALIVYIVKTSK